MSKEAVAEFLKKSAEDSEIEKELIEFAGQRGFEYEPGGLTDAAALASWRGLVVEFAGQRGFEFTADELADAAPKLPEGELSDAELEMIAAGGAGWYN